MVIFGCVFIYVPFLQPILGTSNLKFLYWVYAIPFAIFIFIVDELRKVLIRKGAKWCYW